MEPKTAHCYISIPLDGLPLHQLLARKYKLTLSEIVIDEDGGITRINFGLSGIPDNLGSFREELLYSELYEDKLDKAINAR